MKKTIQSLFFLLLSVATTTTLNAQTVYEKVTIRTLNEYPEPLTNVTQIPLHPYAAKTNPTVAAKKVEFTAIISSYPKNSGLASYNSDGSIGRLHVFVTDTTAALLGREYMSIQVVESFGSGQFGEVVAGLQPGDLATFRGNITFFSGTIQFDVDEVTVVDVSNLKVNGTWIARYKPLLAPVEIPLSEIVVLDEQNRWIPNLANYGKYSGMYVKFKDMTVAARVFPATNLRPYFAVQKDGLRLYTNDISLRFRNDRATYKAGFNRRRPVTQGGEGDYVPPMIGSQVDVSGYLWFGTAFPVEASPTQTFRIAPMDDGKLWEGDVLKESGKMYNGEVFNWPNDIEVKALPPTFSNFTQSKIVPNSTDRITVSATVLPAGGTTLSKVELIYKKGTDTEVVVVLTGVNDVYTYEFPQFENGASVTYRFEATGNDGVVGQLGPNTFVIVDVITDIALIQRTVDLGKGPSPFAGLGDVAADLTAVVVSDATDGVIVIHQSNAQWKGVIVTPSDSTRKLVKGDVINVKLLEVFETATNIDGITRLVLKDFAKIGTAEITNLIPVLSTNNARANPTNISLQGEQWEGMVVRLNNVAVINRQADSQTGGGDFGEFEVLTTARPDTIKGDRLNTGFRINEEIPNAGLHTGASNRFFGNDVNENLRRGSVFASITGVYYTAFGNPKLTPLGGLTGMVPGTNKNWSIPKRNITTTFPATADLEAEKDVVFEWSASVDYDGGNVRYFWAVTTPTDVNFATPLIRIHSDTTEVGVSLPKVTLKGSQLLAAVGENRSLIWTVFISDGKDTVQAATLSTALANLPTNNVYTNRSWPLTISVITPPDTTPKLLVNTSSTPTVKPGQTFRVNLDLASSTIPISNLSGISFALNWTSGSMLLDSVFTPTLFGSVANTIVYVNEVSTNSVEIAYSIKNGGSFNGFGTMLALDFEVASNVANGSEITIEAANLLALSTTGTSIVMETIKGAVKVERIETWPGDTDNNGIVSSTDLLPIGQFYNATGPARGFNVLWAGHPAVLWANPATTFADATGDGRVNHMDVLPIGLNFGKTHAVAKRNALSEVSSRFELSLPEIPANSELKVKIKVGQVDKPIQLLGIAGVAELSNKIVISAVDPGAFLFANDLLSFTHRDTVDHKIAFAFSRRGNNPTKPGFGDLIEFKIAVVERLNAGTKLMVTDLFVSNETSIFVPENIPLAFDYEVVTSNGEVKALPQELTLHQNYPNPFNPSTSIRFDLPAAQNVSLKVFNMVGQEVTTVFAGNKPAGSHTVSFDASKLSSGVYLYRLQAGNTVMMKKMVLMK